MRILEVSGIYPPAIGGIELHVELISRELLRRGHDVAVATLGDGRLPERRNEDGLLVYRLRGWSRALGPYYRSPERRFHPPAPDPGIFRGLALICRERQVEIVHLHDWMAYSALPLKNLRGVRIAFTLHDFSLSCVRQTYLNGSGMCSGRSFLKCVSCASEQYGKRRSAALTTSLYASRPLNRFVDRFVTVSAAVGLAGRADGCIPDDVEFDVIGSPVDAASPATNRPAFLPAEDGYLLFVGALGRHKGLDVLLDAYAGLDGSVPLVLIGTPRHDTPRTFPAGVTVALNVPHGQVMAAWARCSIAVVPSICPEGFGRVAVEAMHAGRPVVASSLGGLAEIVVNGETGVLVTPGDVGALRAALQRLLDDPGIAEELGKAGRVRAQRYTTEVVVDRLEGIFHGFQAAVAAAAR